MYKIVLIGLLLFVAGVAAAPLFSLADAPEQVSVPDRISQDQVRVLEEYVILEIPNAQWATIANTNSMDPVLDVGANALQVIPTNPKDIQVGDIITYNKGAGHIIHRVVFIGEDQEGTYYIVKGDNNKIADPGKVRFEDIDRILVAIVY